MNERIKELAEQAWVADSLEFNPTYKKSSSTENVMKSLAGYNQKFAESIVNECIDIIETHKIPVGNSAAGEMACEWTYDALKQIRDQIKERFGIE